MIRIAVYDEDEASMRKLDSAFDFYAVNRNTEYDVSWFIGNQGLMKIEKYAPKIHIALVSIDSHDKMDFCEKLSKSNSNCRICYYSTKNASHTDISNPLWFFDEDSFALKEKKDFAYKLDNLFNGLKYFGNMLIFNTRQLLHIIPVEEVVYFQSDLKYVNILCCDGGNISIYKKLDDVEVSLSNVFLRVHKSYIVNRIYIEKIDKAKRVVILQSGEELPISNSQYAKVLEELSSK